MKQQGYTLIETMVVTTVIGILAMIAVPNYRAFVERAETTSDTVEGTGERIALAVEALEGPIPSAQAATPPAATAPANPPQTSDTAPASPGSTANPPEATQPPSASGSTPPDGTTDNAASPSTEATAPAEEPTPEPPSTAAPGGNNGGASGGDNAQAALQVSDQYKECTSEGKTCRVKAGDDFEVSFNVQGLGKISEKDIKLVTTGGSKVDDFSYNSKKGTLDIDMKAPDNKNKTFSLTVNAGKEKSTIYFKTS